MENVIENNKLIAEFMGARVMTFEDGTVGHTFWNEGDKGGRYGAFPNGSTNYFDYSKQGYHLSWDWLMPVVEKIEETNFIKIIGKYCAISRTKAHGFNDWIAMEGVAFTNPKSKLESTYKAVVKFINWYNENK